MIAILLFMLCMVSMQYDLSAGDNAQIAQNFAISEQEYAEFFTNNQSSWVPLLQRCNEAVAMFAYCTMLVEAGLIKKGSRAALDGAVNKINSLKTYVTDRIKFIESSYIRIISFQIYEKRGMKLQKESDLISMESNFIRYLELFSDEIEVLIKLLIPLKDCETMTDEQINTLLTV